MIDPSVPGTLTIKPDDPSAPTADLKKQVALQASPGKPGFYEGEVVVTTPGIYTFATENDPSSPIDFRVTEPKFEFGDTALNVTLLKKMAETSGGAFYREEDLYKMLQPSSAPGSDQTATPDNVPSGLGGASIRVPSPQEVELAFSPFYYALMIFVATVEWLLRKRWQLK